MFSFILAISPNDGGLWGNLDQSTPLFRIRNKTMTLLGNLLDTEKILLSEEGYCRDWRGLKDLVSSKIPDTNDERFAGIQNQKNKTGAIIKLWSNPGFNTVIRDLLEALENIGRVDVAQQVAKSIRADCAHAEKSSKPDDHKTITIYNDIVCDQVSIQCIFLIFFKKSAKTFKFFFRILQPEEMGKNCLSLML